MVLLPRNTISTFFCASENTSLMQKARTLNSYIKYSIQLGKKAHLKASQNITVSVRGKNLNFPPNKSSAYVLRKLE